MTSRKGRGVSAEMSRLMEIMDDPSLTSNDVETILDAVGFYKNGNAGMHCDVYSKLAQILRKF